jgi:hypothetical protein
MIPKAKAKAGKAKAEPKAGKAKAEPKASKAKAKADAENMAIDEGEEPAPKKRGRPKKNATVMLDNSAAPKVSPRKAVRSAAPKVKSPSPAPAKRAEPENFPEDVEMLVDDELVEEEIQQMEVDEETPPSPSPMKKAAPTLLQLSPIRPFSPMGASASSHQARSPAKAAVKASPIKASPIMAASPIKVPSPVKAASPVKEAVAAKNVRMSWLQQVQQVRAYKDASSEPALGRSVSAKRKSDAVAPEPTELKRKVARIDDKAVDAATGRPASPVHSSIFGARAAGSATSLPSATTSTTPAPLMRPAPATTDTRNTSRELQAVRERTAAAAAAKRQAAAAAAAAEKAAAAAAANKAPAAGGFLWGALGRLGFGAAAETAVEPVPTAEDVEDEEEAKREATAKLEALMNNMNKGSQAALARSKKAASESSEEMGDVAIVVDDDEDEDGDASFVLPELPTPDIGDDCDDPPFEDGPTSALGAAGLDFDFSTTPPHTPPLNIKRSKIPVPPSILVSPPPPETNPFKKSTHGSSSLRNKPMAYEDEDMADDEEPLMMKSAPKARTGLASSSKTLTQGNRMANKALGIKPAITPVASVARAQTAAKKEEAAKERRAQVERRKAEARAREAEAERLAAEEERKRKEEERKRKEEEREERRKRLAEAERRRKEKEERERKEREAAERAERAAAKAAEEERKRKAAAAAAMRPPSATIKRPPTAQAGPSRLSALAGSTKAPATFRPNDESTIKLVPKMGAGSAQRPSNTPSAAALHAQRAKLVASLDAKVERSEDIVLPDIASEYSNSDDEEKETDFKRPAWADSPQLRSLLEKQATIDPDQIFGEIKPLNMDELFKERQGKFRNRTSSANWSKDGLTAAEKRAHAAQMNYA